MKRLVTYVINVDEDVAESALVKALDIINTNMPHVLINKKTLTVEPHDDYRGIYARIEFDYKGLDDDKKRKASQVLVDMVGYLVKLQLWYVPSIQVSSQIGEIK